MATHHNVFIIIPLFALFNSGIPQSICRPPGPDGIPVCCKYHFIDGNGCKECPVGYRVLSSDYNCTDPCDFPSYGAHCKETCSCSKEECNNVNGCPVRSKVSLTSPKKTKYIFLKTAAFSKDSYSIVKDIVEKITTQEKDNGQLRMLTRQLS